MINQIEKGNQAIGNFVKEIARILEAHNVTHKVDSFFMGELKPLDDVIDMTERQLWCSMLIESYKAKANKGVMVSPTQVADEAIVEYRKRYGGEQIG